jgi:hypothetical protein
VDTESGKRFQVRLDARAAAAVRAGDGEGDGNGFTHRHEIANGSIPLHAAKFKERTLLTGLMAGKN